MTERYALTGLERCSEDGALKMFHASRATRMAAADQKVGEVISEPSVETAKRFDAMVAIPAAWSSCGDCAVTRCFRIGGARVEKGTSEDVGYICATAALSKAPRLQAEAREEMRKWIGRKEGLWKLSLKRSCQDRLSHAQSWSPMSPNLCTEHETCHGTSNGKRADLKPSCAEWTALYCTVLHLKMTLQYAACGCSRGKVRASAHF